MILVDFSKSVPLNKSVNLINIFQGNGPVFCVQLLAVGTITNGSVKLSVSQDNTNFYPLTDDNGTQIILEPAKPIYLNFANLYIKCDTNDVTSADLKISAQ